jgi:hypothetical protein
MPRTAADAYRRILLTVGDADLSFHRLVRGSIDGGRIALLGDASASDETGDDRSNQDTGNHH